jgi:hypothetical protein
MGLHLVTSASGGTGTGDRLADAARMLGGTRERLGRLAERLAQLRRDLGAGGGGGGSGGSAVAPGDRGRAGQAQGANAKDPPAR